MRNILEKVRKRDYDAVKTDAQAIYRAWSGRHAQLAFQRFAARWRESYPGMVWQLEQDLPELLSLFHFPPLAAVAHDQPDRALFCGGPPTNPAMVCFVNTQSVDRVIYSIFSSLNPQWKNRTLQLFTHAS